MRETKKIDINDVEKYLIDLVKNSDIDELLDMYKLLCQPTARFVDDCDNFTIEYDNEVVLSKCECDNTHEQNNTVCRYCWDNAKDTCPICQNELIAGPNGCTICSKDGCSYWRE